MDKKNKKKLTHPVFCNKPMLSVYKPNVENIVLNAKEHKIMWKYRNWLQNHIEVRICLPRTMSAKNDVIFASIEGVPASINYVKRFLNMKAIELADSDLDSPKEVKVELITLSDSESEPESKEICNVNLNSKGTAIPDQKCGSKNLCDISLSDNNAVPCCSTSQDLNSSFPSQKKRMKRKRFYSEKISDLSSEGCSDEVTSTTDSELLMKKARLSESVLIIDEPEPSNQPADVLSQSVLIIEEPGTSNQSADMLSESGARTQHAEDFIPLTYGTESANQEIKPVNKRPWFKPESSTVVVDDDDIKIIDDPKPIVKPRRLRPIVIDGSNVAMEHGKPTHSFSIKGLKIGIDYFLNRGHQVTAFVPRFRKSQNTKRKVPTTDLHLLEELEQFQHVVYTPSRRIGDKCVSSYDDRYIVKFASSNGGVIVSNDSYKDLLDMSEEVKQAIEQRLLQFCFIQDTFMIPDDPYGRNGPTLDEFLSFPPEDQ